MVRPPLQGVYRPMRRHFEGVYKTISRYRGAYNVNDLGRRMLFFVLLQLDQGMLKAADE